MLEDFEDMQELGGRMRERASQVASDAQLAFALQSEETGEFGAEPARPQSEPASFSGLLRRETSGAPDGGNGRKFSGCPRSGALL